MPFAQIVIAPPSSGKATYCVAMQRYLVSIGRAVAVVNLDPANDALPCTAAVDVADNNQHCPAPKQQWSCRWEVPPSLINRGAGCCKCNCHHAMAADLKSSCSSCL